MAILARMIDALPVVTAGSALALLLVRCAAVYIPATNHPIVHHGIEPAAWTPAVDHATRPPLPEAWVVLNADRTFTTCGMRLDEEASGRIESTEVLFGAACGRLWVLLAPAPSIETALEQRLAAAHEAFHQTIQYDAAFRPRLDRVEFAGELPPAQFQALARFLEQLVEVLRGPNGAAGACRLFHEDIAALDPAARHYLQFKAYWEWPAEHYMRAAVIPGSTFDEYVRIRGEMGAGGRRTSSIRQGLRHWTSSTATSAAPDGKGRTRMAKRQSTC